MENIILTSTTRQALISEIKDEVLSGVEELLKKHQSNKSDTKELLTRKEVASLFKVTLPTLYEWERKGILKPFKIGSRKRYKRSEVMAALTEIESKRA